MLKIKLFSEQKSPIGSRGALKKDLKRERERERERWNCREYMIKEEEELKNNLKDKVKCVHVSKLINPSHVSTIKY